MEVLSLDVLCIEVLKLREAYIPLSLRTTWTLSSAEL